MRRRLPEVPRAGSCGLDLRRQKLAARGAWHCEAGDLGVITGALMTGAKRARVRTRRFPASYRRGFGRRLRLARLALGLTEHQAAAAAAVTLQTFRRWEGRRSGLTLRWGAVVAFATALDVSLDWLLTGDPGGLGSHLLKRTAGKVVLFCPRGKAWSGPFSPQTLRTLEAADARNGRDDPRPSS